MGTTWHITIVVPEDMVAAKDEIEAFSLEQLQTEIETRLQAINQSMSTYIRDSEINHFSMAPLGQWQNISQDFYDCLLLSREISELSAGALDITVGPLVRLWGFGPDHLPIAVPNDQDLQAAKQRIDFSAIELKHQAGEWFARRSKNIEVDLSAVAKGFAVDVIAKHLSALGLNDFMVEIGGELRLSGFSPRGDLWRIGIESPLADFAQGQTQQAISLSNVAVATSGDYRNYFEQGGIRYSHTIDPQTGKPIDHNLASVTVLSESAARADALATAFNVLGYHGALDKAVEQNIAVFFIIKTEQGFEEKHTPAFKTYLQ